MLSVIQITQKITLSIKIQKNFKNSDALETKFWKLTQRFSKLARRLKWICRLISQLFTLEQASYVFG